MLQGFLDSHYPVSEKIQNGSELAIRYLEVEDLNQQHFAAENQRGNYRQSLVVFTA